MSFSINTHDLPKIRDYAEAKRQWEKTEPWRGSTDEHDERPLAGRILRNKTIRLTNNGSIALRLHDTDVVIYHQDGSITLNAYESVSTDLFANCLLPNSVSVSFNNVHGYYVGLLSTEDHKTYAHPHVNYNTSHWFRLRKDTITLTRIASDGDQNYYAAPEDQLRPIVHFKPDRKKTAKAAKESGLADFKTWWKAVAALGVLKNDNPKSYLSADELLSALGRGPEGWAEIVAQFRYLGHTRTLDALRNMVYMRHQVFDAVAYKSVTYRKLGAITKSNRRYGMTG